MREPVGFEEVIRNLGELGIPFWTTHDTDVVATDDLLTDRRWEIVARITKARYLRAGRLRLRPQGYSKERDSQA